MFNILGYPSVWMNVEQMLCEDRSNDFNIGPTVGVKFLRRNVCLCNKSWTKCSNCFHIFENKGIVQGMLNEGFECHVWHTSIGINVMV